jgi:hypothetical protein
MNSNDKGLPNLDRNLLNLLFDRVFDSENSEGSLAEQLGRNHLADFFRVIKALQYYNLNYRGNQARELFPLFDDAIGMEMNSEGTLYWLAMGLAVKELYGMRNSTLRKIINQ